MGKFRESDCEIIHNIAIAHLSEKGYLSNEKSDDVKEDENIREEIITALVSVLEVITGNDVDKSMKRILDIKKNLTKFEDLK